MARPKTKTTAQIKNDYAKKAYDDVRLQVKKGKKDIIKAHAEAHGESVNGFINRAIDNQISQDSGKSPPEPVQEHSEAGVASLPPDTLKAAQEAAQSVGETVSQFIERAVSIQARRDKSSLAMGINPSTGGKLEKEA